MSGRIDQRHGVVGIGRKAICWSLPVMLDPGTGCFCAGWTNA